MFNSYHAGNNTQSIQINAVTGAILKNHPKSWFERFNLTSSRAERLFQEGGHKARKDEYNRYSDLDPDKDTVILQMVICGDMEVMAELVYRKDYENIKE